MLDAVQYLYSNFWVAASQAEEITLSITFLLFGKVEAKHWEQVLGNSIRGLSMYKY